MIKTTMSWAILSLAGLLVTGCSSTNDDMDGGTDDGGGSTTGAATTGTTGGGSTGVTGEATTTSTGGSDGGAQATACCPTAAGMCGNEIAACNAAPSCAAAIADFYDCLKTTPADGCETTFLMVGINMDDAGGAGEVNDLIACLDTTNNCPSECMSAGDAGAE